MIHSDLHNDMPIYTILDSDFIVYCVVHLFNTVVLKRPSIYLKELFNSLIPC